MSRYSPVLLGLWWEHPPGPACVPGLSPFEGGFWGGGKINEKRTMNYALDFTGKTVVITGASGGLGGAMAAAFRDCGARVVCVDLHVPEEPLPGCDYRQVDVSDCAAVGELVTDIIATTGGIDCLINNAGISRDAPVWRMSEQDWDAVLNVNLKGAWNFIHHTARHFREKKSGCIVNTASINGLRGKFGLSNYSASKAGLIGLTRTVARELGPSNIRVNAVAPGFILTPLTGKIAEKFIAAARAETALGRLGTPQDVAAAVLFLSSDLARHITGAVLTVDGGQVA